MIEMPNLICPECGKTTVVPVAYGLPDIGTFMAAKRHEAILGGCLYPPRYSHGCTTCGWRKRWADPLDADCDDLAGLG